MACTDTAGDLVAETAIDTVFGQGATDAATAPESWNRFDFASVASLRAHQLLRGCASRVVGGQKATSTARREVAAGKITFTREESS